MWVQIRNSQLYTINTHRCYSLINLLNIIWNCGNNTWAYGICHRAYVHTLQGCILLTVYRIQLFKQMTQICTQQGAFVKTVPFTEKLCVFVGVCWWLCLSSNNETRKYCDRSSADGFICFEVIGSSSGMNKPAQWGTAWFVLGNDFCWVMNWETVEQIGKDLSTGEIKNTRVILSWKPERKRQFRRYRTS